MKCPDCGAVNMHEFKFSHACMFCGCVVVKSMGRKASSRRKCEYDRLYG